MRLDVRSKGEPVHVGVTLHSGDVPLDSIEVDGEKGGREVPNGLRSLAGSASRSLRLSGDDGKDEL